jgi:hypothetical protein
LAVAKSSPVSVRVSKDFIHIFSSVM